MCRSSCVPSPNPNKTQTAQNPSPSSLSLSLSLSPPHLNPSKVLSLSPPHLNPSKVLPWRRFPNIVPHEVLPPTSSSRFLHRHRAAPPLVLRASSSSRPSAVAAEAEGKRPLRGIMKPRPVSPAMQALVGVPEIPRTQALKLIWAYIKQHDLQDPKNKKIIICDEKLKNLFGGRERVGFLEISGLLNPHFGK
ncbi:uncharacterized protein LOC109713422 isoform X2 [Ananas comosus]|uniref:Uncharacterized protein LOC109713422 isoform X2 n=1 Tax=Ananas comosus TaxID=4615 RepID=A0A6P5FHX3_ANACO|nr:uncharacterized protein LOC109713422 isoform X2 [Ananas comosus]